jgi:hypothetical protein
MHEEIGGLAKLTGSRGFACRRFFVLVLVLMKWGFCNCSCTMPFSCFVFLFCSVPELL